MSDLTKKPVLRLDGLSNLLLSSDRSDQNKLTVLGRSQKGFIFIPRKNLLWLPKTPRMQKNFRTSP